MYNKVIDRMIWFSLKQLYKHLGMCLSSIETFVFLIKALTILGKLWV